MTPTDLTELEAGGKRIIRISNPGKISSSAEGETKLKRRAPF